MSTGTSDTTSTSEPAPLGRVPAGFAAADKGVAAAALIALGAIALLVRADISAQKAALFLIGAGLGISLYHAAFGFTGGWRRFIRERQSDGITAHLWLLMLTAALFFPILGGAIPGIKASAALAPVGVSVIVGAFLFGIGMQLGGGCGSGTLFTVGGGHVRMLITLAFFIVGATVGSAHLHWWLALPNIGRVSFIEAVGWVPALAGQIAVLVALMALVRWIGRGRTQRAASAEPARPLWHRLLFGPWPLWWGVLALAGFNLATLLVAGHPWSITFAFGLWGAKIWAALGGDVASWPYWSAGYPARALDRSVLADTTSLMDFGIILGALLAAALAGKFAPEGELRWNGLVSAVIGGLLLGYGARLAFGCNIGALLAGIASGSLHGWVWFAFGFLGNVVGVYGRRLLAMDAPVRRGS